MEQRKIMALLKEAAKPKCPAKRLTNIAIELKGVVETEDSDGDIEIDGRSAGFAVLVESLFHQTLQNKPDQLPALFPAFAMLCGDKGEDKLLADVDWTLVEANQTAN